MGIMMSKDLETNSELNRRISSDLRARTMQMEQRHGDADYIDGSKTAETKPTGKFTWVWIVLIILAIISLLCIVFI